MTLQESPMRPPPVIPRPAPTRLSIEMVRETVRQIHYCRNREVRSSLSNIQKNVEPPASTLDSLVQQFEYQQRMFGGFTGVSILEKQIVAADDQVVVALLTEVELIVSTCEQRLAASDKRLSSAADLAAVSGDARQLNHLYDWLCRKWKFGKEHVRSMAHVISPPSVSEIQASVIAEASLLKSGTKRKSPKDEDAKKDNRHQEPQLLRFPTAIPRPLRTGPKPIIVDLCDTDDDQPVVKAAVTPKTPHRRKSNFQYVDLTWAVDKTNPKWRSKSGPGALHTQRAVETDRSAPHWIAQPRSLPTVNNLAYRVQNPAHGLHELDLVAKRMQGAARAFSQSIPQTFNGQMNSYQPSVPAADGRIFFESHHSMQQETYYQPSPYQAPLAMNLSNFDPAQSVTGPPIEVAFDASLGKRPFKPNTNLSQTTVKRKAESGIVTSVLRALGKHPSLPPLNHALQNVLSRKQIHKDNCYGLAQLQYRTIKRAQQWWRRRPLQ